MRRTFSAVIIAVLAWLLPHVAWAQTSIDHSAIAYFVPDKRVRLEARVTDPKGVKQARTYFKAGAQADYTYVPMQAGAGGRYVAVLPAPSAATPSIEYLILAQNADGQVVRTDAYTVQARRGADTPAWQSASGQSELKVFTELPNAPKVVPGFTDSIALDVAESGARLGAAAGLYGGAGGSAAGTAASTTGTTTATTTATASGIGGLSTAAIVGGVALAGVAAAAAGGGGGGGGGGSSASTSFAGPWSGTETAAFTFSCPSSPSSNGTCTVTFPFSGTVNASNVFNGSSSNASVSCNNAALGPFAQVLATSAPITFTIGSNGSTPLPGTSVSQSGISVTCSGGSMMFSTSPHTMTGSQACTGSFSGPPACNFSFNITYTGS